jgi:hypothetical protein
MGRFAVASVQDFVPSASSDLLSNVSSTTPTAINAEKGILSIVVVHCQPSAEKITLSPSSIVEAIAVKVPNQVSQA